MNITHFEKKIDEIEYTWLYSSVHTISHFPSLIEIIKFIKKSKSDFYPQKKEIYFNHLNYVSELIQNDYNKKHFKYNYDILLRYINKIKNKYR